MRAHFTAASFRRRRETMDNTSTRAAPQNGPRRSPASISSNMKARQSAKLRELRQALVNAGFSALDKQAKVLQLSRSTAWTVMSGSHKSSGLSATIIKRMLTSQQLPPSARTVVLEYVEEKNAGMYGHDQYRLRIFRTQLGQFANVDTSSAACMGADGEHSLHTSTGSFGLPR